MAVIAVKTAAVTSFTANLAAAILLKIILVELNVAVIAIAPVGPQSN